MAPGMIDNSLSAQVVALRILSLEKSEVWKLLCWVFRV